MMLLLAAATCVAAVQEACFWYIHDDSPSDDSAPIARIFKRNESFQKKLGNDDPDDATSDSDDATSDSEPDVSGDDGGDTPSKNGTKASDDSKPDTKTSSASKSNSKTSPANKPSSKASSVDAAPDPEPLVPAGIPKMDQDVSGDGGGDTPSKPGSGTSPARKTVSATQMALEPGKKTEMTQHPDVSSPVSMLRVIGGTSSLTSFLLPRIGCGMADDTQRRGHRETLRRQRVPVRTQNPGGQRDRNFA